MTLQQFRDRLIEDARASVNRLETREHRRRGCLRGLQICSALIDATDFSSEISLRHEMERELACCVNEDGKVTVREYWEFRCATAVIEMVYKKMLPAYGVRNVEKARLDR